MEDFKYTTVKELKERIAKADKRADEKAINLNLRFAYPFFDPPINTDKINILAYVQSFYTTLTGKETITKTVQDDILKSAGTGSPINDFDNQLGLMSFILAVLWYLMIFGFHFYMSYLLITFIGTSYNIIYYTFTGYFIDLKIIGLDTFLKAFGDSLFIFVCSIIPFTLMGLIRFTQIFFLLFFILLFAINLSLTNLYSFIVVFLSLLVSSLKLNPVVSFDFIKISGTINYILRSPIIRLFTTVPLFICSLILLFSPSEVSKQFNLIITGIHKLPFMSLILLKNPNIENTYTISFITLLFVFLALQTLILLIEKKILFNHHNKLKKISDNAIPFGKTLDDEMSFFGFQKTNDSISNIEKLKVFTSPKDGEKFSTYIGYYFYILFIALLIISIFTFKEIKLSKLEPNIYKQEIGTTHVGKQ